LIELLVVIAIIGILAAMVFPVFARAREAARKAVCLSNVKNIALAIQMYMADNNDTLPPEEHRYEVIVYFQSVPGGHSSRSYESGNLGDRCNRDNQANPYLRGTVVLDEYVKNRDVWRCPSARVSNGAMWIVPGPDWLSYYRANEGDWGRHTSRNDGPCFPAHPSGWGGTVTDSFAQQMLAMEDIGGEAVHGVFVQSIGLNLPHGLKLVQVRDPVNFFAVGDAGVQTAELSGLGIAAYPEICALECSGAGGCGWVDWEVASDPACCGDGAYLYAPNDGSFLKDPELKKKYTRHLGGVNCGFLDGHAQWIHSERLIHMYQEGDLEGLEPWGPTSETIYNGDFECYESTWEDFIF
jgi:prepilin-type processing-associated H-X9-DG protein